MSNLLKNKEKKDRELYWQRFVSQGRHSKYISQAELDANKLVLSELTRTQAFKQLKKLMTAGDLTKLKGALKTFKHREKNSKITLEISHEAKLKLDILKSKFGFESHDETLSYLMSSSREPWLDQELENIDHNSESTALSFLQLFKVFSSQLPANKRRLLRTVLKTVYFAGAALYSRSQKKVETSLDDEPFYKSLK